MFTLPPIHDWIPDMHNVPASTQLIYCAGVIFVLALVRMIANAKS